MGNIVARKTPGSAYDMCDYYLGGAVGGNLPVAGKLGPSTVTRLDSLLLSLAGISSCSTANLLYKQADASIAKSLKYTLVTMLLRMGKNVELVVH